MYRHCFDIVRVPIVSHRLASSLRRSSSLSGGSCRQGEGVLSEAQVHEVELTIVAVYVTAHLPLLDILHLSTLPGFGLHLEQARLI